ncbi:hypothetical protein Avbf_04933 [Armadillidium vulgare]|nr:hypothetical protein Avbf_04933 [Armadillidium vulgare]
MVIKLRKKTVKDQNKRISCDYKEQTSELDQGIQLKRAKVEQIIFKEREKIPSSQERLPLR